MIQRIQSIYLFLASGASFSMFGLPFVDFIGVDRGTAVADYNLLGDAVFNLQDNIGLLILAIASGAIALITIFMFKNRALQMKLCTLSLVASIVLVLLAGGLFFQEMNIVSSVTREPDIEFGVLSPIFAIIFTILANRGIKKDDKLVRSADRLR